LRGLHSRTGYASQNEPIIHFGLKGARHVDKLVAEWPSGQRDVYRDIASDQHLLVAEGDAPVLRGSMQQPQTKRRSGVMKEDH